MTVFPVRARNLSHRTAFGIGYSRKISGRRTTQVWKPCHMLSVR